MNPTPPTEPPSLEDIAAAGHRRQRDADRLKKSGDELEGQTVLAALREGHLKPTEVAKASGWTGRTCGRWRVRRASNPMSATGSEPSGSRRRKPGEADA